MFCSKCGSEMAEGGIFCPTCGAKANDENSPQPKVILNPDEVMPHSEVSDSSQTFSGSGRSIGMCFMIISIVADLVGMFTIGFDAFIPITIGSSVLFVIGFLLRMFCQ